MTSIQHVRDDGRSSNVIIAAGWHRKVFVWSDSNAETVSSHRVYEGHKDDILCTAVHVPKQLLATGATSCMLCVLLPC